MKKELSKYIKIVPLVLMLTFVTIIFLMYIKVYYGVVSKENVSYHIVICTSLIIKKILYVFNKFVDSLLVENNIKILIIALTIIFCISKSQISDYLKNFFSNVTTLEIRDLFKMQRNLTDMNKNIYKDVEELKIKTNKDDYSNDSEEIEKIKLSELKMDLLKTMIDDPYIIFILDKFLKKKIGKLTIPMNIFKENTSIESVRKIFCYEANVNSIKIIGIKEDIKDIILGIYIEIKENNE